MKKAILMLTAMLLLLASCNEKEKAARQFAEEFANAITANDTATIAKMYPDASKADSLALSFNADSLQVEIDDDGETFNIKFSSDVSMVATRDSEGNFRIVKSYGIFAYPSAYFQFAKDTGWFDPSLDDVANAERLADTLFVETLTSKAAAQVIEDLKSKVKITKSSTYEYGPDVTCTVVVSNQSDRDIAGDEYSVRASYYLYWDSLNGRQKETMDTKRLTGKPIPAGSTAVYSWHEMGDRFSAPGLQSTLTFQPSIENVLADYEPTGNEYDEYLAERGEQ